VTDCTDSDRFSLRFSDWAGGGGDRFSVLLERWTDRRSCFPDLIADDRSSAGRGGDRFLETAEEGGDRCLELVTAAGGDGDLLLFLTVPGLCSPDFATFGGRPIASKELTGSEA
jgi:hypothetical protein